MGPPVLRGTCAFDIAIITGRVVADPIMPLNISTKSHINQPIDFLAICDHTKFRTSTAGRQKIGSGSIKCFAAFYLLAFRVDSFNLVSVPPAGKLPPPGPRKLTIE